MNEKGKIYEDKACEYLQSKGYEILERNYTCLYGEIDIIAKDKEYIVFVEVKYRHNDEFCEPVETVTVCKLKRITKTAQDYISKHGDDFYRFDAVCFTGEEVDHITNISFFE
ncbi:MAG: YraN family protein [Lachnospiraceae bacterium]|nr:YraN family protein [Lachnospiraceae bacterium]